MKKLIEEYGLIIVVICLILLMLSFSIKIVNACFMA